MGRREFLAAAGATALTLKLGTVSLARTLVPESAVGLGRAKIQVAFVRPSREEFFMSWPGASLDPDKAQAEYTKTLTAAAEKLGLELQIHPVPIHAPESIDQVLEQLVKRAPDGLLVTVMHLQSWPQTRMLLKNCGVPAIVFSPLGTALSEQAALRVPKTFVATTPDHRWLASGLRMLRTVHDLQQARICLITDAAQGERRLSPIGTTLRYIPAARWLAEVRNAQLTDEVRELAKYYAIESRALVEPTQDDLLSAAKNYVAARRIMAAEGCQGISLDCAPLVASRQMSCGPCLAWSRLLDEGQVGGCEGDADAAISLLLAARLCERPGFMQDAVPDTVSNTLIGSHCTCATRLHGFDQPPVPFMLRSHAESNTGVALRVLWQPGQEVTVLKFQGPEALVLGVGRVVSNVEAPSAGGCRTAVEIKLEDVADARDVRGHHQVFVAGRFENLLRPYCELAGVRVLHI